MKFWKQLFSGARNNPEQKPKSVLTEHDAANLLFRLQMEADSHFYTATDDEKRIRKTEGLNALLNILEKAKKDRDFDALFIYEQFPIFQNLALEFAIPDLRWTLGISDLHGVITHRHLEIHRKALASFYREGGHDPAIPKHVRIFRQLLSLLFNEQFQQAETIVEIMTERKVYSVTELCALLEIRAEVASPIGSGAL